MNCRVCCRVEDGEKFPIVYLHRFEDIAPLRHFCPVCLSLYFKLIDRHYFKLKVKK